MDSAMQVHSSVHTYTHLVCKLFASDSRTIRRACVYEALEVHCEIYSKGQYTHANQMIHKPNARMCGQDYEHALYQLQTVSLSE